MCNMNDGTRERLEPLPPSAKLVYYVLEEEGRHDQTGLAEETRLSTRTVRFAVEKLTGAGLVEEGLCPTDARRSVYAVVPQSERSTGPEPDAAAESEPDATAEPEATSDPDPEATTAAAVAED
jgi:DNA-binding Lrp family transcriptional regulator